MSQTVKVGPAPGGQPERRSAPRRRVLKAGKIVTIDRQSIFDCTIRRYSQSGAWLQSASTIGLPDEFLLLVPGQPNPVRCEVVRRTAGGCGVKFLPDAG